MSGVTLQINDLKALERLLGGDGVLEVDIRKSVMLAFVNKYSTTRGSPSAFFDALVSAHKNALADVTSAAERDLAGSIVHYSQGTQPKFQISSKLQQMAQAAVTERLKSDVQEEIQKQWGAMLPRLDELIEAAMGKAIEARVAHVLAGHSAVIANSLLKAKEAIKDLLK